MSDWLSNQPNCTDIVNEAVAQLILPFMSRYSCSIPTTTSPLGSFSVLLVNKMLAIAEKIGQIR